MKIDFPNIFPDSLGIRTKVENIFVHKFLKVEGTFIEIRDTFRGKITIVKTLSGREFFAPSHEFEIITKYTNTK